MEGHVVYVYHCCVAVTKPGEPVTYAAFDGIIRSKDRIETSDDLEAVRRKIHNELMSDHELEWVRRQLPEIRSLSFLHVTRETQQEEPTE